MGYVYGLCVWVMYVCTGYLPSAALQVVPSEHVLEVGAAQAEDLVGVDGHTWYIRMDISMNKSLKLSVNIKIYEYKYAR
jgi:hypothetical protein